MSLLDVFTGNAAKKAAQDTRNYLSGVQSQGNADIASGLATATGQVQGGYSAARPWYTQGYDTATGAVNSSTGSALGYLDAGAGAARDALAGASAAYDPVSGLADKYGAGTSLYLDALGVNGADAAARARDSFTASPGYNYQVDQALEAINRRRAAGGMLNSGNADTDALTTASGLASQEYNTWLGNLQGLINPELSATTSAASGRAGVATNLANLESQTGQSKASTEANRGSMLANLANTYGTNMGNSFSNEGNTLANLTQTATSQKVNLANNVMQPYANTYSAAAKAENEGSKNFLNFSLNAAKAAFGAF